MNTPSGTQAKRAADDAQDSTAVRTLARGGYAANGLVHVLIGVIALQIATGGQGEADQSGALGSLAAQPGGLVVLWVCAIGLFGLALWGALEAFLVAGGDSAASRWGSRLKEAAKAVVYLALGITTLRFAMGGSSDSSETSESASAQVLAAPGGVVLLVIAGLAILAVGGVFVYRGASKKFLKNVALPGGTAGRVVTGLGIAGYVAKGVVLGVLGILVIIAASWKQISYNFLFFVAGLQSVPQSLIEAASIDGAGPFKRFWTIVFPLLAPTTFFLLIVNINYAMFDTFGIIDATTQGGPARATELMVYKIYFDGFKGLDYSGAAAQSIILMFLVICLTVVQFRFIERRIHYK